MTTTVTRSASRSRWMSWGEGGGGKGSAAAGRSSSGALPAVQYSSGLVQAGLVLRVHHLRIPSAEPDRWVVAGSEECDAQGREPLLLGQIWLRAPDHRV